MGAVKPGLWTSLAWSAALATLGACWAGAGCAGAGAGRPLAASPPADELEAANPLRPLPDPAACRERSLAELDRPPTPERARLGRWLFHDRRLSADGTIACATCHQPEHAFSERSPVSTGIRGQRGTRKAPACADLAFAAPPVFFWDGRAASLEEQARGPLTNPVEMGNSPEGVVKALSAVRGYARFFREAFGDSAVTFERVLHALADYERSLVSGSSPYDRWKSGGDAAAVEEAVERGDGLFFGKALCGRCHLGPDFTDFRFHNLGVGFDPKTGSFRDVGRSAVTGKSDDLGAFKTPGLRDVALHPPYMHDGSFPTLAAVMEHYRKGGTPNPNLSPKMEPVTLTDGEVGDLIAMMQALTAYGPRETPPRELP